MTFKDLKKILNKQQEQQQGLQQTTLFSNRIWNKSFWIWNIEQHKAAGVLTNGFAALITS